MEKVKTKILIGITAGDPCGIGSEVVMKALASTELAHLADFVVIGSERVLRKTVHDLNLPTYFKSFEDIEDLKESTLHIRLLTLNNFNVENMLLKEPMAEAGKASLDYILKGVDLAMNGVIDALVTAPINKKAIEMAGCSYPGHTELLKDKTGAKKAVMMMAGGGLRVSLVTTHVALERVPHLLNVEDIEDTITITADALGRFFNLKTQRIAVSGLNPHSGDYSRFGAEEKEIIIPAIERAVSKGINCSGPISPDIVFYKVLNGDFDAVVSLYHDQGLIPLKLIAFEKGVNITLGLPIIRTSPDHGTAYDIAGKGVANPTSMIEAIKVAARMAKAKQL
ncbi:MAG TPA: 4-hydroxythreonine-4-phosphate dehydrogenase PdxA [Candidatus Brocadiia bacterium]|nr:4-hydroxythreonine-4-phosphate dehydrogenase PdxA [Candidatus Brocadiales bacterium]